MLGTKARTFAPLVAVSIEALVRPDPFSRYLERTLDLSFVRELVQEGRYEAAIALFAQLGQRDLLAWAREVYAQSLADQGRYQDAYDQMQLVFHARPS